MTTDPQTTTESGPQTVVPPVPTARPPTMSVGEAWVHCLAIAACAAIAVVALLKGHVTLAQWCLGAIVVLGGVKVADLLAARRTGTPGGVVGPLSALALGASVLLGGVL